MVGQLLSPQRVDTGLLPTPGGGGVKKRRPEVRLPVETAGGRGRAQPHSQGGRGPREHSAGLQRPSRPPPRPPSTRLQKDTTDASASVSSLTSSSWSSPRRPWPAQTASSGWLGTKGPVSRQPPGPGQAGGGVTAGQGPPPAAEIRVCFLAPLGQPATHLGFLSGHLPISRLHLQSWLWDFHD